MSDAYFLGIDIGTTGTKTVLLHETRGIVAQANFESLLHSDGPAMAEGDAQMWVDNSISGIRQVIAESGVNPADIRALATTGMVPALVCLGADMRPLRRPILQNDARAIVEIEELKGPLDDAGMLEATGSAITQQSIAPTLRWLQRNEPALWGATRHLVGSYDYVLIAFGAPPHVEENWAIESGLFTIEGDHYSAALDAVDVSPEMLPTVARPGDSLGNISAAIAAATGLTTDTLLVVGGADHVLSAYAAGVDSPGDWLVKLGGAGDILTASSVPTSDSRMYLDAHPKSGLWLPNGCMATSGSLIRWFQSLIGGESLADLDDAAAERPAAQVFCLPYFLGEKSPLHDPELRGAFVGLEIATTRADMYRAVLEAIAFGFRHNAEVLGAMGIPLKRALVTNGGSKSTLWKNIHANVLGTTLNPVLNHPGASLGAAILAGVGAGVLTVDDSTRFLALGEPILPDPQLVERYDEAYAIWRDLGSALAPISHQITRRG